MSDLCGKLGVEKAAKLIKLAPSRVSVMAKDGLLPREKDGAYDHVKLVHAYIDFLRENSFTNVKTSMTMAEAKQRQAIAKAKLLEIEYELAEKEVVKVDEVLPQWEKLAIAFKTKLLSLTAKLTPLLVGIEDRPKINKILTKYIIEACNELESKKTRVEIVKDKSKSDGAKNKKSDEGSTASKS